MKKIYVLGTLLCATMAQADVPTLQYVLEYYEKQCGNPYLTAADIKEYVFPDIDGSSIATQWTALNAIDSYINYDPQTTYAADLTQNTVISAGYLEDTLSLIQVPDCCKGGVYDLSQWSCVDSCPAANPKCCPGGTIWDWGGFQCVDGCPANNKQCCPDTWDNYDMRCVTCPDDSPICCPNNWDDDAWECVFCSIRWLENDADACPDGWDKVKISDSATLANVGGCDAGSYVGNTNLDNRCVSVSNNANQDSSVCIPNTAGDMSYTAIDDNYGAATFVSGNVYGGAVCSASGAHTGIYRTDDGPFCYCFIDNVLDENSVSMPHGSGEVLLTEFDSTDACKAEDGCAKSCAYAIQEMPIFREVLFITGQWRGECPQ